MSIKKRNLLCIKKKENLDLGHLILYEPYKNILSNLVELAINPEAIEFDPVSKAFSGIESISEEIRYYYTSLLEVTSYYHASKGGRGRYIEKKLSSLMRTCALDIRISEIPLWLTYPEIYHKKGLFTLSGLSREEKSILRRAEWDYLDKGDEKTDIGNILNEENTIVLMELKNRVDSGGTAARREIWTKKFRDILNFIKNPDKKIYKKGKELFSLIEVLNYFSIKKLEIYIGILFNLDGTPATKEGDKEKGFYSSNEEGYKDLINYIYQLDNIKISEDNFQDLSIEFSIENFEHIKIRFRATYGDEIPRVLFRKNYTVTDLLTLKYDDIWLSLLRTIKEREFLLKYRINYTIIFKNILKKDRDLRLLYDKLIDLEGNRDTLQELIEYLLKNYNNELKENFCPPDMDRTEYLSDIIQIIAASES